MNRSYIYTETAFHHQGDMNYMKSLIDESANCGANGIKFQVLTNVNDFVSSKHASYEMLKSYCFTFDQWVEIFNYAVLKKLDIILMPLNIDALKLVKKFSIKYIDIHSVSFNDLILLQGVRNTGIEIILGVGGRTISEIDEMLDFFGDKLKILMVGFQAFPSQLKDVKIGKIKFLAEKYPRQIIGYADHSSFNDDFAIRSNEYARILGATVFEKHITLEEGVERVDYNSAVSSKKIREIIERVNFLSEFILNEQKDFIFEPVEITYRERQLRCVAKKRMNAGSIIGMEDVALKLIDKPEDTFVKIADVINKKLLKPIDPDEQLKKDHFE